MRLFGAHRISNSDVSPLADNIVMLSYQQKGDAIGRTIAVMKTRASRHDATVRTFVIGPGGIELAELPPASPGSRLAHQPQGYPVPALPGPGIVHLPVKRSVGSGA